MTRFIDATMNRSRAVVLCLALILIAGWSAYLNIPKEAEPDIEIPYVYVLMTHEGISPEDSERLLIRPMEQELRALEGVKEMSASAYEGGGSVTMEFYAGMDADKALQDVREKVDAAKAKLPAETEEPRVREVKISRIDPMMVLNISGNVPERTLFKVARDLKDRLEAIPGVLEVDMKGDRDEVMEVVVDPLAMESYGLDQTDLYNLVVRNNKLVAAGSLDTGRGRFAVKVPGVFENPDDVLNLPVKVDGDRVVRFKDVATVKRTFKDARFFARINGEQAVGLEIIKRSGANIIGTIEKVNAEVAAESAQWPDSIRVTISRDKSEEVRDMLQDLQNNVVAAILLVFIVIIGILGLRTAFLVGIAIPGSFLMAMLVLSIAGITVNIVVLFSLIMAVGMLVDGAIVVTELADRKMTEGMTRVMAYSVASKRMAWPIIASTATTLAAFFPLLFWPGISGEFMKYLPITLIITLTASLFMALIFVPTLGGIFGKPGAISETARRNLAAAELGDLKTITGWTGKYLGFLAPSLKRPGTVALALTGLLIALFMMYGKFGRGVEFFPNVEPETASLEIRARGDYAVSEMDAIVRQVENRIIDMPEFESVYVRTGRGEREAEDVIGTVRLKLVNWRLRRPANQILSEVRERTSDLAGIVIQTSTPRMGPSSGKPINLELSSANPIALEVATGQVRAALNALPGLIDVEDSRPLPGIEWKLTVDRAKAAEFDADITIVGNTVQLVTNGMKIGEYRPDDADDEIDIRVRYPAEFRSLDQIDKLRVPSRGGMVPISTFVTRTPVQKVGTIQRSDMRRTLTVQADLVPGVLADDVVHSIKEALPGLNLDPRVDITFKGEDRDQREATEFLETALLIAVFMIAIILVTQFNSIFQAGLILTAVLFSIGGVLLSLIISGMPFGVIMSGVGVISLAGIVVNNNIVLIDTYNFLIKAGFEPVEAILRTCTQRLRPVMLTTVTTILGLLPMVLGVNLDFLNRDITIGAPSSQFWTQLATVIAGGLAFSTVVTLLLTPSLIVWQHNLMSRVHNWREQSRRKQSLTEEPENQEA